MFKNCLYTAAILLFTIAQLHSQSVRLVKDITPGTASTFDSDFIPSDDQGIVLSFDDKILFLVKKANNRYNLWISNGEEDSTFAIHESAFTGLFNNFVNDDPDNIYYLYTTSSNQHIYALSKSTLDTTRLYTNNTISNTLVHFNGALYFSRNSGLWKLDPSTITAELVYQFGFSSGLGAMSVFEDQLIIIGNGNNGTELFRSDGTTDGTESFYQLSAEAGLMARAYMTPVDDKLFFFYKAPGFSSPYYLYVTNGTNEGTLQLIRVDEPRSMNHMKHRSIIGWNGKLYFNANPYGNQPDTDELFVSDGTLEGTDVFKFRDEHARPVFFTPYKNELYFSGNVGIFGGQQYQVHKTDGTIGGTTVAIDAFALPGFGGSDFGGAFMVVHNDSLYFNAKKTLYGSELWVSDGTTEKTRVIDIVPGNLSSSTSQMTSTDNYLFIICESPVYGKELFVLEQGSLSTEDLISESITVTPNPFRDYFNIQFDETLLSGELEIEVFDNNGKVVHFSKAKNKQTINLTSFPSGPYFLILRKDGKVMSKTLLKN